MSLAFYGLMAALACLIIAAGESTPRERIFGAPAADAQALLNAGLGAVAGLGIALLSYLTRGLPYAQAAQRELAAALGPQTTTSITVLAVTSAVGEELLFRAALQPALGFWWTAALFGALHGGYNPKLIAWTVFAFLAGLLLGALADWTGSLLAPIVTHLTVNFWNLHALAARAGRPT